MFYKVFHNVENIFSDEKMQLKFERVICRFFIEKQKKKWVDESFDIELLRETLYMCFDSIIKNNNSLIMTLNHGISMVGTNFDFFDNHAKYSNDNFFLSQDQEYDIAKKLYGI